MKLEYDAYEFIKGEVVDLFERYDVKCIPVSGFELATKMGIVLIPYSSLSLTQLEAALKLSKDGFYFEPGDGREIIYYNDQKTYTRINMTILHEIGHSVLGHTDDMDAEVAEAEAKFFAKYAAAPPPLIHRIKPNGPEDIEAVFDISYEASCYAFHYYHKWVKFHNRLGRYQSYELQLLQIFREPA